VLNKDGTQKKDDSGPAMKSIEQGAATTLFCATSALLNDIGGVHCEDSDIAEVLPEEADVSKMSKGVLPYAVDGYNAERLWDLSYKLTGVTIA